ncbi:UDP-N-acetylmuramoyl-L-alanyl-D-glutamate--2,6-diaminopimelate ligase [Clostridium tertium]|jgi:UDP-N-acetylmuramoyl-L-alanyl-D-glutamate--2,6-diaminopimelate ligase|uniref:UDP-N-acetylmuramoyl-L-alanyl-D-glutamate--2,6-diaminopimelate ligase n=2 Tax=Bacillota TaxID=1239 RepID=A0A9X4B4A3_9CLOT|nr:MULTISPECIES: UDP-N-acetylmuramoyl-L-alanyl-D-glutamate--2,6-diaminopimelate ligase [Clostridium]EEH97641.1 UDP-N-acetylmuramyl-tripeptide synthetase [Clostridium sp. 7_2_43FAA]MBP1868459.1 UDP-N-acetylmuramoyl-L-alanyl-D-glutamate--2,6-diaminopimelate ligase [Clostridium tertium]MBS5306425.1 UDP-N-acetylmuramoyl-L-alanyl-D-glutamate--2,6-diaminopimelate ligase [Clostridium sp.]MBS6501636.1 UDP-N-acetylmuramoyl-L-alanyl-D-glutamate--2,6-diaminopimelate ligase [Clostridium sp.]MBU6135142.1 U
MKLLDLLKGVDYELLEGTVEKEVNHIQYDSRKVNEGDLFVCLTGFEVDGHDYANKAIEAGAKVVLCEKKIDIKSEGVTVLLVNEGRKALATMSANYYGHPTKSLKLIGVTGTNGKTTTVYLLKSMLEKAGKKVGLVGTIANYIGENKLKSERTTPESLELQKLFKDMVDANCEYCVMEVSSHSLQLDRVYGCEFEVGIFTNLTRDHLDFHKSFDNYYNAKFKLFERSKASVINVDDDYGYRVLKDVEKLENKEIKTYSINNNSDFKASDLMLKEGDIHFKINGEEFNSVLPGEYNVYNALGAVGAMSILGISNESIRKGLLDVVVPGRCERIGYKYDIPYDIIIDFAHTPDGLKNILETLKGFTKNRLIAVYGCGGDRDKVKRAELGRIGTELADLAIITSDNPREEDPMAIIKEIVAGITKSNYLAIENRVEAIKLALGMAEEGDVVVLAGKGHENYQITNEGVIHFDEREVVDEILISKKK